MQINRFEERNKLLLKLEAAHDREEYETQMYHYKPHEVIKKCEVACFT